jgi:hypothetical protein
VWCHTCVVVNFIASFSWDILFWLHFPMQMFCSTAVSWDTSYYLFFQAVAWRRPCRPFSTVMMEGRVHKHTVYENLLWVLQTIFPSFDRRQYSGYLLWTLGVTTLIIIGDLQLTSCCGEQLSPLLPASIICM